jgi:hypothetical protein
MMPFKGVLTTSLVAMVVLISFSLLSQTDALWIHPRGQNQQSVFIRSPRLKFLTQGTPSYPITGELVYVREKFPKANYTGKIVIYEQHNLQPKYGGCDAMRDSGATAMILHFKANVDYPGFGDTAVDSWYVPRHPFPVFEISLSQNKSLDEWFKNQSIALDQEEDGFSGAPENQGVPGMSGAIKRRNQQETEWSGRGLMVSIEEDENPWDNVWNVGIPILSNLLLASSGVLLIMASYKLVLLIMREGFRFSIGQCVLWFNAIACVIRMIWAGNPFGTFHSTAVIWMHISLTLPYAFVISGALMIALYWHEMIRRRTGSQMNQILNRMRWPFLALCAVMFTFELASSVTRGVGLFSPTLIFIDAIIYVIIVLALFIFFATTQVRLISVFQKVNHALSESKQKKLKLATKKIMVLNILTIVWIITLLLIGLLPSFWKPSIFLTIFSIQLFCLQGMILTQILLIRAPQRPWKWILCGLCMENPAGLILDGVHTTKSTLSRSAYSASSTSQVR